LVTGIYFCIILAFVVLGCYYNLTYAENSDKTKDKPEKIHDFNFVAAGDFGCGDEPNRTIDGMINKDPEIVIALGDLSYNKSAACWLNSITPLDTPGRIKISIGNHDLTKNMTKYRDYLQHFNMTKPYYSFDYQNVHFLAMATAKNSIIPYKYGSEQYNFVVEDLRRAHSNKNIEWIIVYSFRPFYSSITEHLAEPELTDTYHPLFDNYSVDVVLQAHNHNYQRTFSLVYNASSFFPVHYPEISYDHDTKYNEPNGPIFITVGTGGAELHNFTGTVPYIIEQFTNHGFLNVDITDSKKDLKLSGTFYDNKDMNKKDQFVITKKNVPGN
jgi:predicted MPP superfamily phosphohydrolase